MIYDDINVLFVGIPKNASESICKTLCDSTGVSRNHNHTPIIKFNYKKYYSFCVVRNPYDRFLSAYTYLQYQPRWKKSVDEILIMLEKAKIFNIFNIKYNFDIVFAPQYLFICDEKNNILVNKIMRYEKLDEEWNNFQQKYKVENIQKKNITPNKRKIVKKLSNDQKKRIYNLYKTDFVLFGYQ